MTWNDDLIAEWKDSDGWWHVPKSHHVSATLNLEFDIGLCPWLEDLPEEERIRLVAVRVAEVAKCISDLGLSEIMDSEMGLEMTDRCVVNAVVATVVDARVETIPVDDPRYGEKADPQFEDEDYQPLNYEGNFFPEHRFVP